MNILIKIVQKAIAVLGVSALSLLVIAPAAYASDETPPPSSTSVSEPAVTPEPAQTTPVAVAPEAPAKDVSTPTDVSSPEPVITTSSEPTEPVKTPDVPRVGTDTSPAPPANTPETPKKVFVCKYVGTPGVNERPQSGMNPISVAVSAIQHNQWDGTLPGYFSDAQNRSYVLAYDTGQPESGLAKCPDAVGPPTPVVIAPTATFEQVCTSDGPKITSLLTAGSSDATFQFFAGVIAIGSVDVKAGETYPYVLTLASAYVDSSTTFEIKSGGVSLTGVQRVLSDCNPALAIHPTSPPAADTCNTPPNVPGISFEYGSEPVTNNETGAVTTTTAFEVKEGIYFLEDTALNGVHSYKVTFEANYGYVVAEPDRSIGDTYVTDDSNGGIKVAIWEFPARECPVVTPPPVTTPPVTPPVTTPPVTTPPVTPPVTTPPVTTPPPPVTTVTKSGGLPSAATDLVTPDYRAPLTGSLILLIAACGAYLLIRQSRRRNSNG